jgi:hypothetical protein
MTVAKAFALSVLGVLAACDRTATMVDHAGYAGDVACLETMTPDGGPTLDDLQVTPMECSLGAVVSVWDKPCEGFILVTLGVGVDGSEWTLYDATTRAWQAFGTNGIRLQCLSSVPGFVFPSSCFDGTFSPTDTNLCAQQSSSSATIDAWGGTLGLIPGGCWPCPPLVQVVIPAGALSQATNITIELVGRAGDPNLYGPAIDSGVQRDSDLFALFPTGLAFQKPVTVTVPYSGQGQPVLYMAAGNPASWQIVTGATATSGSMHGEMSQSSYFFVGSAASDGGAD